MKREDIEYFGIFVGERYTVAFLSLVYFLHSDKYVTGSREHTTAFIASASLQ